MKKIIPLLAMFIGVYLTGYFEFLGIPVFILMLYCVYLYLWQPLKKALDKQKEINNQKRLIKEENKKIEREEKRKQRIIKNMAKFYSSEEGQKQLDEDIKEIDDWLLDHDNIKKGEE